MKQVIFGYEAEDSDDPREVSFCEVYKILHNGDERTWPVHIRVAAEALAVEFEKFFEEEKKR